MRPPYQLTLGREAKANSVWHTTAIYYTTIHFFHNLLHLDGNYFERNIVNFLDIDSEPTSESRQ